MTANPRIAKFLSASGVCSRRDAERWIAEGRISMNDEVVTTPATFVGEKDVVKADGKVIKSKADELPRLWVYHKPAGLITSHKDEQDRETVFDHLPKDLPRVISVGRLDLDSEGLLLLTTSGTLARAMELPKNSQERVYRVRIRGTPMPTHLDQLERGVTVEGVQYQPIEVEMDRDQTGGRNIWLTLTLREGKNREIRRIFEKFDLPVSRLIRTRYGNFELRDMRSEEVMEVPAKYVRELMDQLGIGSV